MAGDCVRRASRDKWPSDVTGQYGDWVIGDGTSCLQVMGVCDHGSERALPLRVCCIFACQGFTIAGAATDCCDHGAAARSARVGGGGNGRPGCHLVTLFSPSSPRLQCVHA